ncbi:MAG: asparagine synthase (glutamine-hydrolyzing), partial [bacterium]|nr:asparagine synthase (glutamine-hydrolyzing) [bacterium]
MCGICGWVRFDGQPVDEGILRRMTDSLTHRGPDDSGITIRNRNGFSVGLGHRRLSIIDLSPAGHQPMANEKEDAWIVYNGEIYNFPEIRKDLEPRHSFKSRSDTEVILHLYEDKGEGCFLPLNGMFALAIWDENRRRLVLARDRIGKKPLYYAVFPGEIVFASELKALLFHPRVKREIDPLALSHYLAYEYVAAPLSIFQGVNKLTPGSFLTFSAGEQKAVTRAYWDISFGPNQAGEEAPREAVEGRIRDLLLKSVERRLISDVPLGVFLSGGIDSSAVVAMMSRLRDPGKIQTFTIGFEEKSFDESSYARQVA